MMRDAIPEMSETERAEDKLRIAALRYGDQRVFDERERVLAWFVFYDNSPTFTFGQLVRRIRSGEECPIDCVPSWRIRIHELEDGQGTCGVDCEKDRLGEEAPK